MHLTIGKSPRHFYQDRSYNITFELLFVANFYLAKLLSLTEFFKRMPGETFRAGVQLGLLSTHDDGHQLKLFSKFKVPIFVTIKAQIFKARSKEDWSTGRCSANQRELSRLCQPIPGGQSCVSKSGARVLTVETK